MKGYTINPHFCLDDRTPAGVNVQIYRDPNPNYWESEKRFETLPEAEEFVKGMTKVKGQIEKINYLPAYEEAVLEIKIELLQQELKRLIAKRMENESKI